MMKIKTVTLLRNGALIALGAGLAACASTDRATDRVEVEIRGTDPTTGAAAAPVTTGGGAPAAAASGGGIVNYGDYRVVVARDGDTVASVAARIGVSAAELGAYNGVQPSTPLLAGDELVIPPDAGTAVAAAPAPASLPPVAVEPLPQAPAVTASPLPSVEPVPASDPVVVASAEPLPAAAPEDLAPAAAPSPARAGGWSPDLAAAAIERSDEPDDADDTRLPPPPSASEPVPPAPAEPRRLSSPDLARYQTPTSLPTPFELTRPVDGPVAIPFNTGTGPQRNEGVDFAAPAGATVVAAEDGQVALVSESLGGLGTIVLLRHPNDLMTVYGRLDEVTVQKGDYLERGQKLGVVATAPAGTEPRMHFEVRRGAESLDPMQHL